MAECKECGERVTTVALRVPLGHRDADGNLVHGPPSYIRLCVKYITDYQAGLKPGHDLRNTLRLDDQLRLTDVRVPVTLEVGKPDRRHKIHYMLTHFSLRRLSLRRVRDWLTFERAIYVTIAGVVIPLTAWLLSRLLPRVLT